MNHSYYDPNSIDPTDRRPFDQDGFVTGPPVDVERMKERMARGSGFDSTNLDRVKRYYRAEASHREDGGNHPKMRKDRVPSHHRPRSSHQRRH